MTPALVGASAPSCATRESFSQGPSDAGTDVGATSAEIWAVGYYYGYDLDGPGMVLRWDGTSWGLFDPGITSSAWDIWGSAPDDVWVVGQTPNMGGVVRRWNGAAWEALLDEPGQQQVRLAVWGSAPDDVWVGGDDPLKHWDGTAWTDWSLGHDVIVFGLWGSGPDDVWAVGRAGGSPYLHTIRHWDGSTWRVAYEEPGATLWAVWGTDASHVWAVGDGRILHWDGQSWTGTDSPLSCGDGMGLWGPSANDVWVVGYGIARWNGTSWSCTNAPKEAHGALRAVFGRGPNDVWIASDGADLSHWDGTAWTTFPVELASVRRFWGPR